MRLVEFTMSFYIAVAFCNCNGLRNSADKDAQRSTELTAQTAMYANSELRLSNVYPRLHFKFLKHHESECTSYSLV